MPATIARPSAASSSPHIAAHRARSRSTLELELGYFHVPSASRRFGVAVAHAEPVHRFTVASCHAEPVQRFTAMPVAGGDGGAGPTSAMRRFTWSKYATPPAVSPAVRKHESRARTAVIGNASPSGHVTHAANVHGPVSRRVGRRARLDVNARRVGAYAPHGVVVRVVRDFARHSGDDRAGLYGPHVRLMHVRARALGVDLEVVSLVEQHF